MTLVVSLMVGVIFAGATYLLLRRSLTKLLLGMILLFQAVSLLVFTMGGLQRGVVLVVPDTTAGSSPSPLVRTDVLPPLDPVPQALAIMVLMIGFASMAFLLVLVVRVYRLNESDDLDEISRTDRS
jgi:multicomponent Na+:H+ antiporter subunit C